MADSGGSFWKIMFGVGCGVVLAIPTRPVMIWLTLACRRILRREVLVTELFDFGE